MFISHVCIAAGVSKRPMQILFIFGEKHMHKGRISVSSMSIIQYKWEQKEMRLPPLGPVSRGCDGVRSASQLVVSLLELLVYQFLKA